MNYPYKREKSRRGSTRTFEKSSLQSYDLLFLTWAVAGGFIYYFLLSKYLEVLVKPVFETPVNYAQVGAILPFPTPATQVVLGAAGPRHDALPGAQGRHLEAAAVPAGDPPLPAAGRQDPHPRHLGPVLEPRGGGCHGEGESHSSL